MKLWNRGEYRTLNTIRVERAALHHNVQRFRSELKGMEVAPVLKANAYGHGLTTAAQLFSEVDPAFLVVDSLYEAYEIRKVAKRVPILILGYTVHDNLRHRRLPFHFAVSDMETAKVLVKAKVPLHLKVETGMNRMGFDCDTIVGTLHRLKEMDANIVGVCTHLADADNPKDDHYTTLQLEKFREVVMATKGIGFTPQWIHVGGGGGEVVRANLKDVSMVRLGLSLYGISESIPHLKPAMTVTSTLVGIREVKSDEKISYNGTFVAKSSMRVGVVPFGYYEGMPRSLSNKGFMQVKGVACPIVGRVCMNYTMIDVSAVKEPIQLGEEVVVFSNNPKDPNSFVNQAKNAGMIPYELMVGLAESIRRVIV